MVWTSGTKERTETTGRVVSDNREGASRRRVIEPNDDGKVTRQTLELDADRFGRPKDEIDSAGKSSFRNRYEFRRPTR